MLINFLRLPSRVANASPSSPRNLQSSYDSKYANKGIKGVGDRSGLGLFR